MEFIRIVNHRLLKATVQQKRPLRTRSSLNRCRNAPAVIIRSTGRRQTELFLELLNFNVERLFRLHIKQDGTVLVGNQPDLVANFWL